MSRREICRSRMQVLSLFQYNRRVFTSFVKILKFDVFISVFLNILKGVLTNFWSPSIFNADPMQLLRITDKYPVSIILSLKTSPSLQTGFLIVLINVFVMLRFKFEK